jgi:hypothetical protein
MIISHLFQKKMKNVSDKFVAKIETHILCSENFLSKIVNRVVYEIMWKDVVQRGRP